MKSAVVETVASILERKSADVWAIGPDATVFEAIAEMAHREVGALVVVEEGRLVGIISERDYARKVILQGASSKETLVHAIMTPSPVTVTPEHTVEECMRIVTRQHIRHLPVLDRGNVTGMISIGDLVKAIISAQVYTIDQLHAYITAT
jgi:CBS domain-containing protein